MIKYENKELENLLLKKERRLANWLNKKRNL